MIKIKLEIDGIEIQGADRILIYNGGWQYAKIPHINLQHKRDGHSNFPQQQPEFTALSIRTTKLPPHVLKVYQLTLM